MGVMAAGKTRKPVWYTTVHGGKCEFKIQFRPLLSVVHGNKKIKNTPIHHSRPPTLFYMYKMNTHVHLLHGYIYMFCMKLTEHVRHHRAGASERGNEYGPWEKNRLCLPRSRTSLAMPRWTAAVAHDANGHENVFNAIAHAKTPLPSFSFFFKKEFALFSFYCMHTDLCFHFIRALPAPTSVPPTPASPSLPSSRAGVRRLRRPTM